MNYYEPDHDAPKPCRHCGKTREHHGLGTGQCMTTPAPAREPDADSVARVLSRKGVFAGQRGLEGLAAADAFWEEQPYGTRLYFGPGTTDYLHRSVLQTAIEVLREADQPEGGL